MPAHSYDLIPVPSSNIQAQQMYSATTNLSFPEASAVSVKTTITNQLFEAAQELQHKSLFIIHFAKWMWKC